MIILGIDPGTTVTGYGIIKYENNAFTKIASGVISLPSTKPIPSRLKVIHEEINKIIKLHKPDEFAIETAFYGKNVQSAMKIGYTYKRVFSTRNKKICRRPRLCNKGAGWVYDKINIGSR